MLQELWQQKSVFYVAEKYQVNRGTIQFLLNSAANFASSVVRFCDVCIILFFSVQFFFFFILL